MSGHKFGGVYCDSLELMRFLAKMANMDQAGIVKMVLVLDVSDVPRLYVSSFLDAERVEVPEEVPQLIDLEVTKTDKPVIVDTTSLQNVRVRTHSTITPSEHINDLGGR